MDISAKNAYFCPSCKKPVAEVKISGFSIQSGIIYSDGVKTDRESPFSSHFEPSLGKCPFCNDIFFVSNLKPANKNVLIKKNKNIINPEKNDFIKALEKKLAKTPDEEIEARLCVWQVLNEKVRAVRKEGNRDLELEKEFFSGANARLYKENCAALISLFEQKLKGKKSDIKNESKINEIKITMAEIHRNLGNFDACFDIIESLPAKYEWLKLKYMPRTASNDRLVFALITPEEKTEDFAAEDVDLNDPDKAIEYYTRAIETNKCALNAYYPSRAAAYMKKGELQLALNDITYALEISNDYENDYFLLAQIYEKMGETEKSKWNIFRARHVEAFQYTVNEHERRFPKPQREGVSGKPFIGKEKVSVKKSGGKVILYLASQEEEPVEPEILYSGGDNALFRRRPDQFILLEKVPDDFFNDAEVRDAIFNKKEALISENGANPALEYTVKIRLVIETLESAESIIKDGYPLFTSLRARVSANMNRPITDVIGKEDCINLAAVLAREENYQLLDKYISEKLPLNEKVSFVFGTWRPTVLYYVTVKRMVGFMEDPLKIIRFLAANGADPNMACEEGDTPLGNQCLDNGLTIIMKTLLESGADPNCPTESEAGPIAPLHLTLFHSEYDEETQEFTPIKAKEIEKVKLLVDAGADVNYSSGADSTALSLAINNSEGSVRKELVKTLLDKGANVEHAIKALEKAVEQKSHSAAYSLYEIYSSQIEGLNVKPDPKLSRKYLLLAADLKYKPENEDDDYDGYDDGKYDGEL